MKKVTFSLVLLMAGALSSFTLNAKKYTVENKKIKNVWTTSQKKCIYFCKNYNHGEYVHFVPNSYCECTHDLESVQMDFYLKERERKKTQRYKERMRDDLLNQEK